MRVRHRRQSPAIGDHRHRRHEPVLRPDCADAKGVRQPQRRGARRRTMRGRRTVPRRGQAGPRMTRAPRGAHHRSPTRPDGRGATRLVFADLPDLSCRLSLRAPSHPLRSRRLAPYADARRHPRGGRGRRREAVAVAPREDVGSRERQAVPWCHRRVARSNAAHRTLALLPGESRHMDDDLGGGRDAESGDPSAPPSWRGRPTSDCAGSPAARSALVARAPMPGA
jgi:hypothetical protein